MALFIVHQKKLVKARKQKNRADLNLCFGVAQHVKENTTLLKEKWMDMLYHISDIHHWDGTEYTQCSHGVYTNKIKWLDFDSPAFQALSGIVNDKTILNDMKYLTEFRHTGNLEVYHSLLLKYCTKRLHFSMAGMIARTELAIMDFNSGVQREQAT